MYLARVVGSTVATQKDPNLEGAKLMLVQLIGPDGTQTPDLHVAVDAVGAGIGSVVVVVIGSGARLTEITSPMPVDAAIVGIVDSVEMDGRHAYSAATGFVAATPSAESAARAAGQGEAGSGGGPSPGPGARRARSGRAGGGAA
jgi:microcompartment protein CcmK/EutM